MKPECGSCGKETERDQLELVWCHYRLENEGTPHLRHIDQTACNANSGSVGEPVWKSHTPLNPDELALLALTKGEVAWENK